MNYFLTQTPTNQTNNEWDSRLLHFEIWYCQQKKWNSIKTM